METSLSSGGAELCGGADCKYLEQLKTNLEIWIYCKPLKSHKTAKTFLGNPWHWNHRNLEMLAQKAWRTAANDADAIGAKVRAQLWARSPTVADRAGFA